MAKRTITKKKIPSRIQAAQMSFQRRGDKLCRLGRAWGRAAARPHRGEPAEVSVLDAPDVLGTPHKEEAPPPRTKIQDTMEGPCRSAVLGRPLGSLGEELKEGVRAETAPLMAWSWMGIDRKC